MFWNRRCENFESRVAQDRQYAAGEPDAIRGGPLGAPPRDADQGLLHQSSADLDVSQSTFWRNVHEILEIFGLEIQKKEQNFEKSAREKNLEIVDLVKGFPTLSPFSFPFSMPKDPSFQRIFGRKNRPRYSRERTGWSLRSKKWCPGNEKLGQSDK